MLCYFINTQWKFNLKDTHDVGLTLVGANSLKLLYTIVMTFIGRSAQRSSWYTITGTKKEI